MKKILTVLCLFLLIITSCSSPEEKSIAVFDEQINNKDSSENIATTEPTTQEQQSAESIITPEINLNIFNDPTGKLIDFFEKPMGIIVDKNNFIYIVDQSSNTIFKFNNNGQYLAQWGTKGKLPGEFNEAKYMTLSKDNYLFVTDTWNQRIQIFKPDGTVEDIINLDSFGPKGITIYNDKIYYADTGHHTIKLIAFDGKEISSMGKEGNIKYNLHEPTGIINDNEGNIYIIDSRNNRIVKTNKDLKHLTNFKIKGWNDFTSGKEASLAYDNSKLYLSDPVNGTIKVFSTDGKELPDLKTGLKSPSGLYAHNGFLYVVDYGAKKFHKIKLR